MKKVLLYSTIILMTLTRYQITAVPKQPIFTPKNSIILWDLNGVLIKSDAYAMLATFWQSPNKATMLWQAIPTCIHLARTIGTKKASFEEIIRTCQPVNPLLADLMRKMSSCQKISPGTAAIIKELHTQGYTMAIASNMGIATFEAIREKNKQFFDCFSVITTSDTIDLNGSFVQKPDPQFFVLYQQLYNKEGKNIIFIDDNQSNVTAATAAGMYGILFKSPKQLRHALKKINIICVA